MKRTRSEMGDGASHDREGGRALETERKGTEQRKEEIFMAMVEITGTHGFNAVTTTAVAKHLGISQPAIYKHFKNKDGMILYFIDHLDRLLGSIMERAASGRSTRERLMVLLEGHLEMIERTRVIPRIVFSDVIHIGSAEKRIRLQAVIDRYRGRVRTLLERGKEAGEVRSIDTDTGADIILGAVLAAAMRWMLSGMEYSLTEKRFAILDYLEKTLFLD